MPLPNDTVIPAGLAAAHADTVAGQMAATGTIDIPASLTAATFNETTGRDTLGEATRIYTGAMRIQRLPVSSVVTTAEIGVRTVTLRQYRVAIPLGDDGPTQDVPIGAVITVTDPGTNAPAALKGRSLAVIEVPLSTIAWQQDLICEEAGPTNR